MAKKYSASERKAFHMGVAYAAAKAGKRVACPDEKTKKSFRNGVKAVRGGKQGGGKKSAQAKPQFGGVSGVDIPNPDDIHGALGGRFSWDKKSGRSQGSVTFVPGIGTCRINSDGCIMEVL